jgi:prephenate dehydrogenase
MQKVVLAGAGGKMGFRLTRNLNNSDYEMSYVEISPHGMQKLGELGITVTAAGNCVPDADFLILAVPDIALGMVSREMIPMLKSGAMVVTLDPAAALAGKLFQRDDVSYFITHPAHPSI